MTGAWALAGAPLGLLLGFFLAKGDLCSAAAIGETLVLRDDRKLFGLWVAAVTCMVGFAALAGLFAVVTLIAGLRSRRRRRPPPAWRRRICSSRGPGLV